MEQLQDQHRMFIQAFMWKKICSSEDVLNIYKKCHEKTKASPEDLKEFVQKINFAIGPMNMKIKKGIDELTGEQYYVLVNEADNQISRLSNEYTTIELELFKKIVHGIIESHDGKVTNINILNLSNNGIQLHKGEIENTVKKFSQDGWLLEENGQIYFSTRAIVELQHFFKENFSDSIVTCFCCKNIVFQGDICQSCDEKIHTHCKDSYFKDTKRSDCPNCRAAWR